MGKTSAPPRYLCREADGRPVELGVVGKPNVGKSTFFAAATLAPVQIANYPFTTIDANRGVAYVRKPCPHVEIGRPCKPNNAPCKDGTRLIPVELLDVAGLVPKAHEGRGLGNKFLDDLRQASALVHVIGATGGPRRDAAGEAPPDAADGPRPHGDPDPRRAARDSPGSEDGPMDRRGSPADRADDPPPRQADDPRGEQGGPPSPRGARPRREHRRLPHDPDVRGV